MKKILIISPHFPPSNLAAVHRTRLFANHLPSFGWTPIILTVHENFYEEGLDYNLERLISPKLQVEKVKAFKVTRPRLIGDIGLRGFIQLKRKAKQLIREQNIDFLYIPIPSFYCALLGRLLHDTTGIRYGIDYIDPWVHTFPGSNKIFSRHWFSTKLASILEPIAIKKAVLITGVAEGYFKGVQERNPELITKVLFAAMPYGGEKQDHIKLKDFRTNPYLFTTNAEKVQLVYAGAMLPKAYAPLEAMLMAIAEHKAKFKDLEIHFIGTGKNPNDKESYNVKQLAQKYDLWKKNIFEYPSRIPYLDVLVHLNTATGIFILGSTEAHYTPSKIYQAVLSEKPIWAILHKESSASEIINKTGVGTVLNFQGEKEVTKITNCLLESFESYRELLKIYTFDKINYAEFEKYSAKAITSVLAASLNKAVS